MSARWVLLALGLALAPAAARAAGSPRIVLVAPEPGDRVAVRIRAELRAGAGSWKPYSGRRSPRASRQPVSRTAGSSPPRGWST